MYVLNIHNMPKIFWGAWPLIIFERPKCSKVLVPLSKLSVSKNVWFTNARFGPLDFIHSEMLKRGMGGSGPSGKQPLGSTISGAGPPLGATKGYSVGTWRKSEWLLGTNYDDAANMLEKDSESAGKCDNNQRKWCKNDRKMKETGKILGKIYWKCSKPEEMVQKGDG